MSYGKPLNIFFTKQLFMLLKDSNPTIPWYLPYPESPTPPKGKYGLRIYMIVSLVTKAPDEV